jgi:hypothetical protein
MPQGKGTYGSQVGRPPEYDKGGDVKKKKGKKELKGGGMDALYGVDQDVEKMSKTNAQDRVKKYAVGEYVVNQGAPTLTSGGPASMWSWENYLEDKFNETQRGINQAERDYMIDTHGGSTLYDAQAQIQKQMPKDDPLDDDTVDVGGDDDVGGEDFELGLGSMQPGPPSPYVPVPSSPSPGDDDNETLPTDFELGDVGITQFEQGGEVKAKYPHGGGIEYTPGTGDSTMTDATGDPGLHNQPFQSPFEGIEGGQGGLDTDSGQYWMQQNQPGAGFEDYTPEDVTSNFQEGGSDKESLIGDKGNKSKEEERDEDENIVLQQGGPIVGGRADSILSINGITDARKRRG